MTVNEIINTKLHNKGGKAQLDKFTKITKFEAKPAILKEKRVVLKYSGLKRAILAKRDENYAL